VFEADWYAQTQVASTQEIHFDDPGDVTVFLFKGRELLSQYYHLPRSLVRESELPFTLPLVHPTTGEVLEVPLRGFIDLVEDDDVIVEFKTAQKAAPLTDLPDNIQLTAYAYAHAQLFGRPPREIRKVSFVRTKIPKIETQITGRAERDFARLFHLGREVLNGIGSDVFLPNRGCWLCASCEFRQDCDEWTGNQSTNNPVEPLADRP
jgi:hypothetical protein